MKQATVAIEDKRFYRHQGVDFEGVVRAAFKNVQSDQTVQGGSTLTMQLIKNLYTEDRARDGVEGYKRKIREARLAEELENVHSGPEGKNWILTKYINSVPYGTVGGQEAVGIQAAARVYFNKRAADLTLPEAALLAGLPQAPSLYSPFRSPEAARARRVGPARAELERQSPVGEELVRGLMRTQLGLALRLSAVVAVGLGGLPLLFAVAPAVAGVRPFGVPPGTSPFRGSPFGGVPAPRATGPPYPGPAAGR